MVFFFHKRYKVGWILLPLDTNTSLVFGLANQIWKKIGVFFCVGAKEGVASAVHFPRSRTDRDISGLSGREQMARVFGEAAFFDITPAESSTRDLRRVGRPPFNTLLAGNDNLRTTYGPLGDSTRGIRIWNLGILTPDGPI